MGTSEVVHLQQGWNTAIPSSPIIARLRWSPELPGGAECDASGFLIGITGKVRSDLDFIFYGAQASSCGGITLNSGPGYATFVLNPERIPVDVTKIALTVSLPPPATWAQALSLSVCVEGVADYAVDLNREALSSLIVCEAYRRDDAWRLRAVGQGIAGGLGPMAVHYGVEIQDDGARSVVQGAAAAQRDVSGDSGPRRTARLRRGLSSEKRPITILLNSHFHLRHSLAAAFGRRQVRFVLMQPSRSPAATRIRTRNHGDTTCEPVSAHLDGVPYGARLMEIVRRHDVDVALIGRRMGVVSAIVASRPQLRTRFVCAASPDMLNIIDNKALTYRHLRGCDVPLPPYEEAWTPEAFEAAVKRMTGIPLCYKPMQSIYGRGFHILVDHPSSQHPSQRQRAEPSHDYDRSLPEALAELSAKGYSPQLVTAELPGLERSIDCIAVNGKLACAIVRKKVSRRSQVIESNDRLVAVVRKIASKFKLNGLFNVQFRDDADGQPYLLEINPRMSGGIHYTFASGVNLPHLAVLIALGAATHRDVPSPRMGIVVDTQTWRTPATSW